MTEKMIPHSRPCFGMEEAWAVTEVLNSGYLSQGEKVERFEKELASFLGVKGAVLVNSGTSAIHLGLLAMGIGEGDDVILPSFVCSAPLNAVYAAGATPRVCDIELESFNISFENVEMAKTDETKAVIVPHMFGNVADLEKIERLGIPIIEDCAHSIGARYGKRMVGSIGKFSIVSFYTNKMIGCGEGGAILSDDEDLFNAARDLRDYDEKESYKIRYNYKMTDLQAAIGLVQLARLRSCIIRYRKEVSSSYDKFFSELDIVLPKGEFDHVYYRYVVRTSKDLDKVIAELAKMGVSCARPVYKPLHRYLEMRSGFGNTDEAYSTALSIPIYPSLEKEEQKRVIKAVITVLK